jgi:hypothetical protein
MKIERTFSGLEVTTRAQGFGRFFGAAFLTVWLAFWAAGEVVVLGLLVWGGWSLLTGQPPRPGEEPLRVGPALTAGVFLLVWLVFWTIGGWAAFREWSRLVFGRARLLAAPDGLTSEEGIPPFIARQLVPRTDLRRVFVGAHAPVLSAETAVGVVELLRGPSADQLREAAEAINREYRLSPDASAGGFLPRAWVLLNSPEGVPVVVRDPAARRRQARVLGAIALAVSGVALLLLVESAADPNLGALAAIVTAAAGFCTWGTLRLARRREEWIVARGRLQSQVRTGARAAPRFTAAALQIEQTKDSDGDPYHRLLALSGTEPIVPSAPEARGKSREILGGGGDPTELLAFGRWLAERTGLPCHDRTTPAAKAEEVEDLRRRLRATGRFGRWVAERVPGTPR